MKSKVATKKSPTSIATVKLHASSITALAAAMQKPVAVEAPRIEVPKRSLIETLRAPLMVKIAANGERLPDTAKDHAVVWLPEFNLQYEAGHRKADNWQHALKLGKETNLLDGKGWQCQDDIEAQLTIRRDKYNPAIDTNHFPNTPTDRIWWTRTPLASSPSGSAFCVYFYYGFVHWNYQLSRGFVRACRLVPASQ